MLRGQNFVRGLLFGGLLCGILIMGSVPVLSAADIVDIESAIFNNDMAKVQKWLAGKPKINGRSAFGVTPLMFAAGGSNAAIVKAMLSKGADAKLIDNSGSNALHFTCRGYSNKPIEDKETITRLLLTAGAPVNQVDKYGDTPLLIACRNLGYAIRDNVARKDQAAQLLNILLEAGALTDVRNAKDETPLYVSVFLNNSIEMAGALLMHKAGIDFTGPGKSTAINSAASSKNIDMVKFFLESGANPNLPDINGTVPLHNLVDSVKYLDIVKLLIKHSADVNFKRRDGRTPLSLASWSAKHNAPMIQLLKDNGAY
jgi:ankyrin repeat protein